MSGPSSRSILEDCAAAYVASLDTLDGADGTTAILETQIEVDERLHDLILAAGSRCKCDDGTCPGLVATGAMP